MLRERILTAGIPGVGKTYSWLTIARALTNTKFYCIDPDDGVRRVWYNEFPEVKNIEYYFTPKWFADKDDKGKPKIEKIDDNCYHTGVAEALRVIRPKLKADHWLVVEHLGILWNKVQEGFADEVFDKDIGQYFLEVRKEMKAGAKRLEAFEGWTDWQVINKLHNDDFINTVCFDTPCHVYLTTSISPAPTTKEDTDLKTFYGDNKIRLDGQKQNPYRVQSMLLLSAEGKGDSFTYYIETFLKDRGRQFIKKQALFDFYLQYLCGVAGW